MLLAIVALAFAGCGIVSGEMAGLVVAAMLAVWAIRRTVLRFDKIGALVSLVALLVAAGGYFVSGGDDEVAAPAKTAAAPAWAPAPAPRATPPAKRLSPAEEAARALRAENERLISVISAMLRGYENDLGNDREKSAAFERRAAALARTPDKAKLVALQKEMELYGVEVLRRRQAVEKTRNYYKSLSRSCTDPNYYARKVISERGSYVTFCYESKPIWFPKKRFSKNDGDVLSFTLHDKAEPMPLDQVPLDELLDIQINDDGDYFVAPVRGAFDRAGVGAVMALAKPTYKKAASPAAPRAAEITTTPKATSKPEPKTVATTTAAAPQPTTTQPPKKETATSEKSVAVVSAPPPEDDVGGSRVCSTQALYDLFPKLGKSRGETRPLTLCRGGGPIVVKSYLLDYQMLTQATPVMEPGAKPLGDNFNWKDYVEMEYIMKLFNIRYIFTPNDEAMKRAGIKQIDMTIGDNRGRSGLQKLLNVDK